MKFRNVCLRLFLSICISVTLFYSCQIEESEVVENKSVNFSRLTDSDIDFLALLLEESEFTHSRLFFNEYGELDIEAYKYNELEFANYLDKKSFVRLKISRSIETSDGEKWEDTKSFKSAISAVRWVGKKLDEYGGDCIESRTEKIDLDGDGEKDDYRVFVRPCS